MTFKGAFCGNFVVFQYIFDAQFLAISGEVIDTQMAWLTLTRNMFTASGGLSGCVLVVS